MQKDIWWMLHSIVLLRWYGCIDNSNWAMHNLSQNNTLKHYHTNINNKRYYTRLVHGASLQLCHPFSITITNPSDYPWSLIGPSSFLPSVCSCNKSATSPNIEKRMTGTPPKLTPGKHRPSGCLALVLRVRLPSKEHMAWSARKTSTSNEHIIQRQKKTWKVFRFSANILELFSWPYLQVLWPARTMTPE